MELHNIYAMPHIGTLPAVVTSIFHDMTLQSALHEAGAASALCRLLSRCNSQQDGLGNACGPSSGTSLLSHVVKAITNLSRKHAGNQDALVAVSGFEARYMHCSTVQAPHPSTPERRLCLRNHTV